MVTVIRNPQPMLLKAQGEKSIYFGAQFASRSA
jgi:hypothetical protein